MNYIARRLSVSEALKTKINHKIDSADQFDISKFDKHGPEYKLFSDIQYAVDEYYKKCINTNKIN